MLLLLLLLSVCLLYIWMVTDQCRWCCHCCLFAIIFALPTDQHKQKTKRMAKKKMSKRENPLENIVFGMFNFEHWFQTEKTMNHNAQVYSMLLYARCPCVKCLYFKTFHFFFFFGILLCFFIHSLWIGPHKNNFLLTITVVGHSFLYYSTLYCHSFLSFVNFLSSLFKISVNFTTTTTKPK